MLLDMVNLVKLRKAVLYLLVVLAVFLIQELVLSNIAILGVKALIFPIAVVAAGFWNGGVWGGMFGLIIGIFADMSLNTSSVMMTVIFPIIGFFSGALPMFFMSRKLMSFFFLSLAGLCITAFCQMFRFIVFFDAPTSTILLTALFQVLWALPFIPALFYPCRAISGLDLSK